MLWWFSPAWFRALLRQDEVDWEVRHLADLAGVSPRALWAWLSGIRRPHRESWRRVAAVLALERCAGCGGSGTRNPGIAPELLALDPLHEERVRRQRTRKRQYQRRARAARREQASA